MGVVEVLMVLTVGADGVGHTGPDRFSTPGCKAAGALPPEGGKFVIFQSLFSLLARVALWVPYEHHIHILPSYYI